MSPKAELIGPSGVVRLSINFPGNVVLEQRDHYVAIIPETAVGASVINCVDSPSEIQKVPVLRLTKDQDGNVFQGKISTEYVDIERAKLHEVVTPVTTPTQIITSP